MEMSKTQVECMSAKLEILSKNLSSLKWPLITFELKPHFLSGGYKSWTGSTWITNPNRINSDHRKIKINNELCVVKPPFCFSSVSFSLHWLPHVRIRIQNFFDKLLPSFISSGLHSSRSVNCSLLIHLNGLLDIRELDLSFYLFVPHLLFMHYKMA